MSLAGLLLILRIFIALSLYLFLTVLFWFLLQDVRAARSLAAEKHQTQASLVVVECDEVPLEIGLQFGLQRVTTLGRGPTCSLVLPDSFASMEHARISFQNNQWWLTDLQSRNGTRLNEISISGRVVLSSGDLIGIGRVLLRFEID